MFKKNWRQGGNGKVASMPLKDGDSWLKHGPLGHFTRSKIMRRVFNHQITTLWGSMVGNHSFLQTSQQHLLRDPPSTIFLKVPLSITCPRLSVTWTLKVFYSNFKFPLLKLSNGVYPCQDILSSKYPLFSLQVQDLQGNADQSIKTQPLKALKLAELIRKKALADLKIQVLKINLFEILIEWKLTLKNKQKIARFYFYDNFYLYKV